MSGGKSRSLRIFSFPCDSAPRAGPIYTTSRSIIFCMNLTRRNYTTAMPHINLPFVETAPGTLTRVEFEGRSFVIVRTEAEIYAYVDACPHAFWPLSEGTLRDGVLECPGHGW